VGGTHIVYAVTLHSHTLSHILQQCARYYPAILSSRKLSFRIFLGCSCLALFAAAAAAYPAQNCADRHRQTCHRHYRTQCRLELSFQGLSEQSARSHLSLCDHLCFHTRWSYGAIKNNFAADIGTVSDGRAEVLEQMPPGISLSVRRASCTTLPTVTLNWLLLPNCLGGLYS